MGSTEQIRIDKDNFTSAVTKAAKTAKGVKAVTIHDLEKTNVKPFRSLKVTGEKLNKTMKSIQSLCAADTKNMKTAADNIVDEDQRMADKFKENTVRFT